MAEKILYYLGAGASAEALPLAKSVYADDLEPEIPGLAFALKSMSLDLIFSDLEDERDKAIIANMRARFKNLSIKADEFGDVDTYAKYLHLMHPGGRELINLKRTLSEFFSISQLLNNGRDGRYLPWLVSIMSDKRFPENVKILNWNYDFQIELAASQIGQLEDVDHNGSSFSYAPSNIFHFPNLDPTFSDFANLSLIHLNGIAGFAKQQDFKTASVFQKSRSAAKQILSFLENNAYQPQINFAWEKGNYHSSLSDHIKLLISGTTILVVIGYSFPFFNREMDKEIFKYLESQNSVKKIYYQDPILNGQQLKSQFDLHPKVDIVHIQSVSNFHIPFEY